MNGLWIQDIESFEAISQDDDTRKLFLQMAEMSKAGRLGPFLVELNDDEEIDDQTKGTLTELAQDSSFLLAVEDYCRRTRTLH